MDPRMMMQMGAGSGQGGGLSQFFSGLMGQSGAPYEDFMNQFQKYMGQAQQPQNAFLQAGTNAIPQYQNWLTQQSNPSQFINNQMGNYQESPWAKNMQNQAMRTAQNFGSANGLTGSTPLMMQAQQNAGNIASQDQNNWLQNVLGVNTNYGNGLNNMTNTGQHSADQMSQIMQLMAQGMGAGAFGQQMGEQKDRSDMFGGLLNMFQNGILGSQNGGGMSGMFKNMFLG
jgi:hypothetical protein